MGSPVGGRKTSEEGAKGNFTASCSLRGGRGGSTPGVGGGAATASSTHARACVLFYSSGLAASTWQGLRRSVGSS